MDTLENSETTKGFDGFPFVEADLPAQLGCSREKLAALRNDLLTRNRDFTFHKGRVCLSTFGLTRVLDALGLPEMIALPEKPAPGPVTFAVHPRKTLHRQILLATDGQRVVRVRVHSKENFRPGMKVTCTLIEGDLYQLVGRCPRSPGKY